MQRMSLVETWLNTVAYSHSGSKNTEIYYRRALLQFCEFVGKTPEQLLREYENGTDREFKRKYARYLRTFIAALQKEGYAVGSISSYQAAVKSFFKYNDLPMGFVPSANMLIEFHNRDISREEILELLRTANPRDRSYFSVMAQCGLRPGTISGLKIKDVEKILDDDTPVPCKVTVRQENTKGKFQEYFSFIGADAVRNLKDYLKTREDILTLDSWLFIKFGHPETPMSPSVATHQFKSITQTLRDKDIVAFDTKRKEINGKLIQRHALRLYCLRKFFRKHAGMAGADFVNYWMGHSLGVDEHYFSRDPEHHREIYREKAMPHLRLETITPTETDKIIAQQAEEIERLKRKMNGYDDYVRIRMEKFHQEMMEEAEKRIEEAAEKWKTESIPKIEEKLRKELREKRLG